MVEKGRLKKELDKKLIKQLASVGCTHEEIGAALGCSAKTLQRNYVHLIKEGRLILNASLRRMQYLLAQKENATMLIWLGKQYLKQTDRTETEHSGGTRVEIIYGNKKKKS